MAVTESKGLSTLRAQIQYSLKKNNFLDSYQKSQRLQRGTNKEGNASSPSLHQKVDDSGCYNDEEPLTERFMKEDNLNSKSNSLRRHAYENEYMQPGVPMPDGFVSISPQTKRKSPPMASGRPQERRFANRGASSS